MNDDVDDMPLMVRKGYDAGTAYIETLNSADVYDYNFGSPSGKAVIRKVKSYPAIDNNDIEFAKGFNGAIADYLQDHEVDWHWIFNQVQDIMVPLSVRPAEKVTA